MATKRAKAKRVTAEEQAAADVKRIIEACKRGGVFKANRLLDRIEKKDPARALEVILALISLVLPKLAPVEDRDG